MGEIDYPEKGAVQHDKVTLTVTQKLKTRDMLWETVYQTSEGSVERFHKSWYFDEANSRIEMHNKGLSKDWWSATGLNAFAHTGEGTFTATEVRPAGKIWRRVELTLLGDALTYVWQESVNGTDFRNFSVVHAKRASQQTGLDCGLGKSPS